MRVQEVLEAFIQGRIYDKRYLYLCTYSIRSLFIQLHTCYLSLSPRIHSVVVHKVGIILHTTQHSTVLYIIKFIIISNSTPSLNSV